MAKKPEDLLFIERCFAEIKNKNDVNGNLKKIERTLKRLFGIEFVISIANNTTNEFFGMNIYPQVSTMDLMVENIVAKESNIETVLKLWQNNTKWYLEIDSILLYDITLSANPSEITAILLHEVGHIVYSNTVPQRLYKVLKYKLFKLNYQLRKIAADEKLRKLFNITIVESCTTKNFNYINMKKERIADKFVIHYGYGKDLDNFIDKLLATQGNRLINRSDKDMEVDLNAIVNWTIVNIKQLEFRKDKLRDSLKVEILRTPSDIIKKTVQNIYMTFFGDFSDKYREVLSEQYTGRTVDRYAIMEAEQYLCKHVERILKEAYNGLYEKNGKFKKVNKTDIAIIEAKVQKIKTEDDKIYLLDTIYNKLELINISLECIEKGKTDRVCQTKITLEEMKSQLETLREEIMDTRIPEKNYGVYIRYPNGYKE